MLEMNEKIPLPPPRVKIVRYMFLVLAWVFFVFIIVQVSLATVKYAHHLGGKKA